MIRTELELKISKEQMEHLEKMKEDAPLSAVAKIDSWMETLQKEIDEYLTSKENSTTLP